MFIIVNWTVNPLTPPPLSLTVTAIGLVVAEGAVPFKAIASVLMTVTGLARLGVMLAVTWAAASTV
jgi:hypothetical protein